MGLADRDYMRRPRAPLGRRRWWRESRRVLAILGVIAAVGSAGLWLSRDAQDATEHQPPAKGSLRVNVNTGTTEELESLPGIGPSFARLIIAHRPYSTTVDLLRVHGFGRARLDNLQPFVTVTGPTEKLDVGMTPQNERRDQPEPAGRLLHWARHIVWLPLASLALSICLLLPWLAHVIRSWWQRRSGRQIRQQFDDAERRRWEGHKRG